MGKFDGMLLVSDFDNTLLCTDKALQGEEEALPPMCERNTRGIRYWMAEGGIFAVATGRAMAAYRNYHPMVPTNAPAVVDNGGAIYDFRTDEYLLTRFLPVGSLARIRAAAEAFPGISLELYHGNAPVQVLNPSPFNLQHAKLTRMEFREIRDLKDETVEEPISKALFNADRETLDGICRLAQEQGWRDEYELIYSSDHLLEMTARGATKGTMTKLLARQLGCTTLICVGDHLNDLPMLEAADRAFCPANAQQAVKDRVAQVVCRCSEGAIGEIIEILDREIG